jgi:predicted Zn-dependent protease
MRDLGIFVLDKRIVLFDDVLKDKPEKIVLPSSSFVGNMGFGILKRFKGLFEKYEIIHIQAPKWDEIDYEDFYVDTSFPFRSGFTDEYIIKTLKKRNKNHKYCRILGIYPGTIWSKTDCDLVPHISGTSESNIAIISLQIIFENDAVKLLNDCINISCHEIGHTFGLKHHDNCVMSPGNEKPFFCRKCLRRILHYARN